MSMGSNSESNCKVCGLPRLIPTTSYHSCPFCDRRFKRVDGARRHSNNCPSRNGRPLPAVAKRGRRSRACDRCASVKVACDSNAPCGRCAARALPCTYSRFCTDPVHWEKNVLSSSHGMGENSEKINLPFLLACTNPTAGPVDQVILDDSEGQEPRKGKEIDADQSTLWPPETIDPSLLFFPFFDQSLFEEPMTMDPSKQNASGETGTWSAQHGPINVILDARIRALELDLRQATMVSKHLPNVPNTSDWTAFFTLSNFQTGIDAFFGRQNLLATVVHEPSFRPDQVHLSLLLAIAIAGSIYMYHGRSTRPSTSWSLPLRESAEAYIFEQVEKAFASSVIDTNRHRKLELCQAAYILCTLQSCIKDVATRRRVITRRHPALVSALRRPKLLSVRHEDGETWEDFVYRESCVRLAHWTFINDAWFSLVSNNPPAMTIHEMSGDLPCDSRFWTINQSEVFVSMNRQGSASMSLRNAMTDLLTQEILQICLQLQLRHFLIVILAFHHVIYHYQTSVFTTTSKAAIRNGLDKWRQLWDTACQRVVDKEIKDEIGLVKHVPEVAVLLNRILESGGDCGNDNRGGYLARDVVFDTSLLYAFVKSCCT